MRPNSSISLTLRRSGPASIRTARAQLEIGTLIGLAQGQGFHGEDASGNFDGKGSDKWNGEQFARMWRGKLLHIFETGEWLRFDPTAGWLQSEPEADRAAKQVLDDLKRRAANILIGTTNEGVPQRQLRHIEYTSKAANLRAMIEMAKSEPEMTRRLCEFDADPMLLGVANGVIDLRKGALFPVSPGVLVSKRCRVAYDPTAACPLLRSLFGKSIRMIICANSSNDGSGIAFLVK